MSEKLKTAFAGLNLQAAADQILTNVDSPQERIALLNKFISGDQNPSFEQSEAIINYLKKSKKSASEPTVRQSRTVTTPASFQRRPTSGMTW